MMNFFWSYQQIVSAAQIKYGRIYKGYIVNDARGFCPAGWSFPTVAQIDALRTYLDPTGTATINIAGRALKESGTEFWDAGNDADNSALFYGRGAGLFQADGAFINFKQQVIYWGITPSGTLRRCMTLTTTATDSGTMTGNDGSVYRTITIGSQVWMAENSIETQFSNGESIPIVTNATDFAASAVSCMASPNYDDSLM